MIIKRGDIKIIKPSRGVDLIHCFKIAYMKNGITYFLYEGGKTKKDFKKKDKSIIDKSELIEIMFLIVLFIGTFILLLYFMEK